MTLTAAISSPASSAPPAIEVRNLGKRYQLGAGGSVRSYRTLRETLVLGRGRAPAREANEFWALRDVSFNLNQGEILGVIGRNGAGKSTLLKLLSRVTTPTVGSAQIRGRVGSLLEVGTGFHPELSGRENILLNGAILGMGRREILGKLDEIVAFADVARFLDTPVKRYSSGMYLRLAFAVAAHLEPEILLVDEVLAVGDAEFQKKCLGRMGEIGASGRTVVFISHSMPAMLRLCPRLLLLDHGIVLRDGPAAEVVRHYLGSDTGSTASRRWSDPATAPGDDVARLKSVRVLDGVGTETDTVDIRREIVIEVDYWHVTDDAAARPSVALQVRNGEGQLLFLSHDFVNREWHTSRRRSGTVRATCHIPGNLLAEGTYSIDVGASSHHPDKGHFEEREAVTFSVVDHSDGDGVRGDYQREWPGLVRPMLNWDIHLTR